MWYGVHAWINQLIIFFQFLFIGHSSQTINNNNRKIKFVSIQKTHPHWSHLDKLISHSLFVSLLSMMIEDHWTRWKDGFMVIFFFDDLDEFYLGFFLCWCQLRRLSWYSKKKYCRRIFVHKRIWIWTSVLKKNSSNTPSLDDKALKSIY